MLEFLQTTAGIVTSLSVLCTAFISAWIMGVRPIVKFSSRISTVCELVERELKPNGGKTLRDSIDRIEEAMHLGASRSRTMLEHTGICFWESNAKGVCIYVSRNLCRLVERTEQEMLGQSWRNSLHPKDAARVEQSWDDAVAERREFSLDYSYITPTGRRIYVHGHAYLQFDSRGEFVGLLGAVALKD